MIFSLITSTAILYRTSSTNRGNFRLGNTSTAVKSSIEEVNNRFFVVMQFFLPYLVNVFLTFYYRQERGY
jgi:hypothetical protein